MFISTLRSPQRGDLRAATSAGTVQTFGPETAEGTGTRGATQDLRRHRRCARDSLRPSPLGLGPRMGPDITRWARVQLSGADSDEEKVTANVCALAL